MGGCVIVFAPYIFLCHQVMTKKRNRKKARIARQRDVRSGTTETLEPEEVLNAIKQCRQLSPQPDGLEFLRTFGFLGGIVPPSPENDRLVKSDVEAMRGDWMRVGGDLRLAIIKHQTNAKAA